MARLLLLSNGHGEDLSGALLGRALSEQGHDVQALPLVGQGNPYRTAGIPLLGRTREYSTGGIGYTSLRGRLTELMQGQLLHLLEQLLDQALAVRALVEQLVAVLQQVDQRLRLGPGFVVATRQHVDCARSGQAGRAV